MYGQYTDPGPEAVQENLADQHGFAVNLEPRTSRPDGIGLIQLRGQVWGAWWQLGQLKLAAAQSWMLEQDVAQRPVLQATQMPQWPGKAGIGENTAGENHR